MDLCQLYQLYRNRLSARGTIHIETTDSDSQKKTKVTSVPHIKLITFTYTWMGIADLACKPKFGA
jgi:hypothetical protein